MSKESGLKQGAVSMCAEKEIKVSVIMPAYNSAAFIRQAVQSVYEQTTGQIVELLIVDNGSKDDTLSIAYTMKREWEAAGRADRILEVLQNSVKGVSATRNMGIQRAKGSYVAFLDSDDWWDVTKLEKQLALLEADTSCKLVCSARELMQTDGSPSGRVISVRQRIVYQDLLKQNHINCSSVVVDRQVALEFPMEHDDSHEDYIMWLRILRKYGYALAVNEPLLKTRLSAGGKSRNKIKSAQMTWKVYRYMGFSPLKSAWCFIHYMIAGVCKYSMISGFLNKKKRIKSNT